MQNSDARLAASLETAAHMDLDRLADALAVRLNKPAAPPSSVTLAEFFTYYIETHAKIHTRIAGDLQKHYRLYLQAWSDRRLHEISHNDVRELQALTVKTKSEHAANRAVELLSALYNKANEWEMFSGKNPATGVKKFKRQSRDRFLLPDELPRFFSAVQSLRSQTTKDCILMHLLTAQRTQNVCQMMWTDIDLIRGVWHIPRTKNGTSHNVPLVSFALDILQRRRAADDRHPDWVFPQESGGGPKTKLQMAWSNVLARADIANLCIHDLRRTHASWQAITGVNTTAIGATLNHKDPKSTAVYARLYLDPVRDAMQKAVDAMMPPSSRAKARNAPPVKYLTHPKHRNGTMYRFIDERKQQLIESKILEVISETPHNKSSLQRMIGGTAANAAELQRILDEMVGGGRLRRVRAPHRACWLYASA